MRLDDLNSGPASDEMIEPKSEIEFGDQSCQTQTTANYGTSNIDYNKTHQRMTYDDAGPSSAPQHSDQWLDDKHFMAQSTNTNTNSSASTVSNTNNDEPEQQRCKSKNYKALEPCSCPLCSRVYSNISNLRQHMRLIHNPTSVCCPLCQKSFTSDLYLKRHYLSMHGSTVPSQVANAQQNTGNSSQHQSPQNSTQQQSTTQSQQVIVCQNFCFSSF